MFRAHRAVRTSFAAVVLAGALFTATACSEAQKAIDCIELGTQLANDVSNLQGVINDPDAASESLQDMSKTLKNAADEIDSQEVKDAIDKMITEVDQMSRDLANKQTPSVDAIGLLRTSSEAIAKACAS